MKNESMYFVEEMWLFTTDGCVKSNTRVKYVESTTYDRIIK